MVIRGSDSRRTCESSEYEREEREIIFALLPDLTARIHIDSLAREKERLFYSLKVFANVNVQPHSLTLDA